MPASDEFKNALRSGDLPEAFMMAMGNATELNITTRVIRADSGIMGESDPAQTLHTRLDLLNGTIENDIGEAFLTSGEYKDLQQFHQQQVALGNRKIQENFQSLQQLFRLLVTLQQYNRLKNAEEPLDLAFLEVPSHILPAEKVIPNLKEQQATLEPLPVPVPTAPPVAKVTPPVQPPEPDIPKAVQPIPVAERPKPIPPKPMPPKPMRTVGGVAAATAIATHPPVPPKPKAEEEEALHFLDSFAALDLDEVVEPDMPLSDLEIDDWETPIDTHPAQRLADNTPEAYVPSLDDFDHEQDIAAPVETDEDFLDLDHLLDEEPETPLDDLLEEPEPLEALDELLSEPESFEGLDALNHLLETPETEMAAIAAPEPETDLEAIATFDEFATMDSEEVSPEIVEALMGEGEDRGVDDEVTNIALGQPQDTESQTAVDPDLEALLVAADTAHESLTAFDLLTEDEIVPSAPEQAIADSSSETGDLVGDTLMAEPALNELLAEAAAVTPELTADLLENTLDQAQPDTYEAIAPEPSATPDQSQTQGIDDAALFDFLNQDWQANPDVMEITSLDDEADPNKATLKPLSDTELAELEDIEDGDWLGASMDDDWQPLPLHAPVVSTTTVSAISLDLGDDIPAPLPETMETEDLPFNAGWQHLTGSSGQSINVNALLPLELDTDDLPSLVPDHLEQVEDVVEDADLTDELTADELDELDLDEELAIANGQGDHVLGLLDSVDAQTAVFTDEVLDLAGMSDETLPTSDDFEPFNPLAPVTDEQVEDDFDVTDGPLDDLAAMELEELENPLLTEELDLSADVTEVFQMEMPEAIADLTTAENVLLDDTWQIEDLDDELAPPDELEQGLEADIDAETDLLTELPDPFAATTETWAEPEDTDWGDTDEAIADVDELTLIDDTTHLDFDQESLSDEVLSSIAELEEATAELKSPEEMSDVSLLAALNAPDITAIAPPAADKPTEDLDTLQFDDLLLDADNLEEFAQDELDLDSGLDALDAATFLSDIPDTEESIDLSFDDDLDLTSDLASDEPGDNETLLDDSFTIDNPQNEYDLDADFDALDAVSFSPDIPDAEETIDLGFDEDFNDDLDLTSDLASDEFGESKTFLENSLIADDPKDEYDLDADFDALENTPFAADVVADDPLDLGFDDDFDLLSSDKGDSEILLAQPLTMADGADEYNLDADFDALDAVNLSTDDTADDPIALTFADDLDLSTNDEDNNWDHDQFLEEPATADSPEDPADWDNLDPLDTPALTDDWDALQPPITNQTAAEDWELASLTDLGDLESNDLSGLGDFDLDALENDDNDDEFDLFGNEESDPFNPFLEAKS